MGRGGGSGINTTWMGGVNGAFNLFDGDMSLASNYLYIDCVGKPFNEDEQEAVARFAAGEDKRGLVIDCVQRGYKLGEHVLRYAKVVVGE